MGLLLMTLTSIWIFGFCFWVGVFEKISCCLEFFWGFGGRGGGAPSQTVPTFSAGLIFYALIFNFLKAKLSRPVEGRMANGAS